MAVLIDLTNQRFGRWLVLNLLGKRPESRDIYWYCRCDCGVLGEISGNSLRRGLSTSCGCYRNELASTNPHYKTPTYNSWDNMIGRCYRESQPDFQSYGGRGIIVCDRWRESFQNFLQDMGERPDGMTLDRQNVNGNYEPGNCHWATNKTQQNNKQNSLRIPFNDEMLTFEEYSLRTGVPVATLRSRRFLGVPLDKLHLTPKQAGVL